MRGRRSMRGAVPALAVGAVALLLSACGGTRSAVARTTTTSLPPLPPAVVAYVTLVGTGSSLGLGDKVAA
ncbi:MAG: hypothetical protein ACYCXY_07080, partial [Acidimicrobiales bacterium]